MFFGCKSIEWGYTKSIECFLIIVGLYILIGVKKEKLKECFVIPVILLVILNNI